MAETEIQVPVFEFSGNHLCLDFTNTIHDRANDRPRELLTNYSDLVAWGQQAQIVTDGEVQGLLKEAERHPDEALRTLERAIAVREAIFRIFRALAEDEKPAEGDLDILNKALAETMSNACIVLEGNGFTWDWADRENRLERVFWPVVRSAADLLTSEELDAVRICAAEDCNWLFLDTSKNHSRRWCDMKTCGNRAKVRRHYERRK